MSRPAAHRLLLATMTTLGLGLLGTSVSGIATADGELARAVQAREAQPVKQDRPCPPAERRAPASPSVAS
jgi:hypothetical protein